MSTKPLTSWSFSRWDKHNTCPLKFKLEVLDGRKEDQNPAMLRGETVHKVAAAYLTANEWNGPPPPEFGKQIPLAAQLRQPEFSNIVVEQQWGYNRQWATTGWFDKDSSKTGETWLRSIIDVAVLYEDNSCEVIDWKTGKPRGTHEDQMELFAVSVMARYPIVTEVDTRLAYMDFNKAEYGGPYPRADLEKLIAKWEGKVRPMFEDTSYLPRPGEACKFCQFSRSRTNGQDCRFG